MNRLDSEIRIPKVPLATTRLDVQLLQLGLATPEELGAGEEEETDDKKGRWNMFEEERTYALTLADKLRRLFDHDYPEVHDVRTTPVWVAGELLQFEGDFNKYVTSRKLQKQEGIIFRHLLRLILLVGEFMQLTPPETDEDTWRADLISVRDRLTASCRAIDTSSTDKVLDQQDDG